MVTAEQILSLFPHKEGVYRLFSPCRVVQAWKLGWLAVHVHDDGRVLMWLDKGRLKG